MNQMSVETAPMILPLAADTPPACHEVEATVLSNDPVNSEYCQITLELPVAGFPSQPGQFFQLRCPTAGADHPFLRRPMSIYDHDHSARRLGFLYKIVGAGTRGLARLRPGDSLNVLGPLGRGFQIAPHWRHVMVLGRGVGIAALAPLAPLARARGIALSVICSARSPDLVMTVAHFRKFGAPVTVVTDSESTSAPEQVATLIRQHHTQHPVDALFSCGTDWLLPMLQNLCAELHIPGQIAMEQQMACGLGMCQACVRSFRRPSGEIEHRRVCRDGPVFPQEEVIA